MTAGKSEESNKERTRFAFCVIFLNEEILYYQRRKRSAIILISSWSSS